MAECLLSVARSSLLLRSEPTPEGVMWAWLPRIGGLSAQPLFEAQPFGIPPGALGLTGGLVVMAMAALARRRRSRQKQQTPPE